MLIGAKNTINLINEKISGKVIEGEMIFGISNGQIMADRTPSKKEILI